MIKVENIDSWGFEHAIRGMRNPMNSWDKSDTEFGDSYGMPTMYLGENDLALMKKLYKAGTEHRKYLRQIFVSMDITAPLYWWKEFDTYKVGTVANSCSTMHTIHKKEFTLNDFSYDQLTDWSNGSSYIIDEDGYYYTAVGVLEFIIKALNQYRKLYLDTKDKQSWYNMIQLLPSSYNQKRTITMNYENVITMIKQRTGHKLDEWNIFVEELKKLPYIKEIIDEK